VDQNGESEPAVVSIGVLAVRLAVRSTTGGLKAAIAAPPAAAKPPVVIAAPIKKRAMKKPNVTWRYGVAR
jgi:hypothetical protein